MFTGIVTAVGRIAASAPHQGGLRLSIDADGLPGEDLVAGESIAVAGVCLTVTAAQGRRFACDVSGETLRLTTLGRRAVGDAVNLERALRAGDRLGGHLVSGHVDGIGQVTHFAPVGESWELRVLAPKDLARFLAYKGSVAVNGVSLTVNRVDDRAEGCEFSINLIPHTVQHTTLGTLAAGSRVNLEVDLIARYVERMLK